MTDPLAALLRKVMPRRGDLVSNTDWDNAAHMLREKGVILKAETVLKDHDHDRYNCAECIELFELGVETGSAPEDW